MRKGYFPVTRFSDDIDFTTTQGLDQADAAPRIEQVCAYAQAQRWRQVLMAERIQIEP